MHEGKKHYNIREIRELLQAEAHIKRVVQALYGRDAAFDREQNAFFLGHVAGGAGKTCRIDIHGDYCGKLRDLGRNAPRPHCDMIDAVEHVRGVGTSEAVRWLGDLLGATPNMSVVLGGRETAPIADKTARGNLREASGNTLEINARRLWRHDMALTYLRDLGLNDATIDHFHLGIPAPYTPKSRPGNPVDQVICSPIIDRNGVPLNRMPKTPIPGVTCNPTDPKGWCPGAPQTTWDGSAAGKRWIFVCEELKEQWRLWDAIQGSSLAARIALVACTPGDGFPDEWKSADFWHDWDKVFFGHGNDAAGEEMALSIRSFVRREVLRVEAPRGKGQNWVDFFRNGGRLEGFEELLQAASPMGEPHANSPLAAPLEDQPEGYFPDDRVNINGAFVGGKMFYPFLRRRNSRLPGQHTLPDGSDVHQKTMGSWFETAVLCSNGAVYVAEQAPAPPGTPPEMRCWMLSDGTVCNREPSANQYATWPWDEIEKFIQNKEQKLPVSRPASALVQELDTYLRQVTWLPNDTDYALLAAYVMISYVYNAFDAIPNILINGGKGAGKSTLASAIADLSYNGAMMGGGSDKALARFVDEGRGLLVVDDLERVGRRGKGTDDAFSDINQFLKLSYAKHSGKKIVFEKGVQKVIDFFGPKVITNISGIDPVNESRMYTILCRLMPRTIADSGKITGTDKVVSTALRHELHAWGMDGISTAHAIYRELLSSKDGRAKEIAAPLLVIARMVDVPEFTERVEQAILRHQRKKLDGMGPDDLLRIAMGAIVRSGARQSVSSLQIQLGLSLIPEAAMQEPSDAAPPEMLVLRDAQRVSAMLLNGGMRTKASIGKQRLSGHYSRTYTLDQRFVADVLEAARNENAEIEPAYQASDPGRTPLAFCEGRPCRECPYQATCDGVFPELAMNKKLSKRVGSQDRSRPQ